MTWSFRKMSRGEMNADPIEGEFFTPEGLADALIRESVQNSLDARSGNAPVRVRFFLATGANALSANQAKVYLEGLEPHLGAVKSDRSKHPLSATMPYLLIEDFGTRGLCGSTEQDADAPESRGSGHRDFFYFWRNIGRSRKQEMERGRWGLGKTVFPATSLINSFFGLTLRSEDSKSYLMGQSVLKIHKVGSERYCPYGFFAETDEDEFQLPYSDSARLRRFRSDFQLRRNSEPGLSIVVPYPDAEEIDPAQMVRSAILHYFYPLVRGELVIEVEGEGINVLIDSTTIDTAIGTVDWSETSYNPTQLRRLFDLVRRIQLMKEEDLLRLSEPAPPRAPDWNKGRFDDGTLSAIKKQFSEQNALAIRVPITVQSKDRRFSPSYFDVFVEHDDTLLKPEDHYIRQGITISRIQVLREKGFRGLVVVGDRPLSTLLGDAENPAHTEWLEKATKLKERHEWGPFTVRFVRSAIQRLVGQLMYVPEGRDEQLLKNIFFLEEPTDIGPGSTKHKGNKEPSDNDDEDIERPPTRSEIKVTKVAGGFRIARGTGVAALPDVIAVEVAYEVRRGNPFSKYERFDFRLQEKPIAITAKSANCEPTENTLTIEPTGEDFVVEVTGFDPHRDLAVRALPKQKGVANATQV